MTREPRSRRESTRLASPNRGWAPSSSRGCLARLRPRSPACRSSSRRRPEARPFSPGVIPDPARPSFQELAISAASWSGVTPCRSASASSTQGRNSDGAKSGKLRRRFPMSPLGSMMRQGMPLSSASSRIVMPRPGLARAGHAHDHAMRGEIGAVIDKWLQGVASLSPR